MEGPGVVFEMATKDWEKAEDFDTEEGQAEDVGGGWEAGGEHCAGHKGGVCGE